MKSKRVFSGMILLILLLFNGSQSYAFDYEADIKEVVSYYDDEDIDFNDWEIILSMYSAGVDLDETFYNELEWNTETISIESNAATYGSRMLALVALGKEPRDIWDRDLVAELEDMQQEDGLFGTVTDDIYAGIALETLEADYDREAFISAFIDLQNEDGGYGFVEDRSDLDTSGVALALLAKFTDFENVEITIEKVKLYVKDNQLTTGGFASWGTENSNTISKIISGLIAVGDRIESEYWLVDDNSMLDALNSFKMADGGYAWIAEIEESNLFSTKQALIAISELSRNKSLFDRLDEENQTLNYHFDIVGIDEIILEEEISYKYTGNEGFYISDILTERLAINDISFTIEDTDYGPYLSEINGIIAGTFGGYDGWQYQINGDSGLGLNVDTIENSDNIIFYYGGYGDVTGIPQITVMTEEPTFMEYAQVKVEGLFNEFDENYNATTVTKTVQGASVVVNDVAYITDEYGIATVLCNASDVNDVVVYKLNESGLPELIYGRTSFDTVVNNVSVYNDDELVSDWAKDSVYNMRSEGIMEGYDNTFSPKDIITKAQLVKVLMTQLDIEVNQEVASSFEDVGVDKWYYSYIATAESIGLIEVGESLTFNPDEQVTRELLATMIAYAYELSSDEMEDIDLTGYSDYSELSSWAIDSMESMIGYEILSVYNNVLSPKGTVTREMCAVVLTRVDKKL